MAWFKYVITLIILFFISISSTFSNLEIIEVYPNPLDWEEEYIIVKNNSNWAVNWFDYIIADKSWKSYKIGETLSWFSTKKLLSSETKIILNNSDEKLFIKDTNWVILSTFSYKKSEKWQKIDKNILDNRKKWITISSEQVFEKTDTKNSSIYFYFICILLLLAWFFTLKKKKLTK